MRQIFYRAAASYGYEKTEPAYKRLLYISRKARRGGLISFREIRDDSVIKDAPLDFAGLSDFKSYLTSVAGSYRRQRQHGQARRLVVLCEAGGMVPQLARVCRDYGIPVQSAGGYYNGVNVKYDLAVEAIEQPTTILHIGDLDPSGEDMFTVIKEDVAAFVRDMAIEDHDDHGRWIVGKVDVEAVRVAATREQAIEMNLPTAPAKDTDSRTKRFQRLGEDSKGTVQCEAIQPDRLRDILREAIDARIDQDVHLGRRSNVKRGQARDRHHRVSRLGRAMRAKR